MSKDERLNRIDEDIDQRVGVMLKHILHDYEISSSTQNILTTQVRIDITKMIVYVLAEGLIEKANEGRAAAFRRVIEAKQIERQMKEDLCFETVKAFYVRKQEEAELPF